MGETVGPHWKWKRFLNQRHERRLAAGLRGRQGLGGKQGGQLAPRLRQRAWEGDPSSAASEFGRKSATDGVSQRVTAECRSKSWCAVGVMGCTLSHFPFHVTLGTGEAVNETLTVNGARTRLKSVKNFSQEICLLALLYHSTGITFQFAFCLFSPGCHCSCLILKDNNLQ